MAQVIRSFDGWRPAAAMCLAVALGSAAAQAADGPLEYQIKAVFLLNFTKFIEWPATAFESTNSPVAICILGDDPFGNTLDQIVSGEIVNGRKVVVERINHTPEPKTCQVLFWSRPEKDVSKTLSGLGPGVLTVGEGDGFLREGGMISFVIDNRRVRFDIRRSVAENARLKLSSRLLNVARLVAK